MSKYAKETGSKVKQYFLWILVIMLNYQGVAQTNRACNNYSFDHLVFFVNDSTTEATFEELFTQATQLSTSHPTQGTKSIFYVFYNTYIELIYLTDEQTARANEKRFGSDYTNRWGTDKASCHLGVGVILSPFDSLNDCLPLHVYRAADNKRNEYYLMSGHNASLSDILLYASPPATKHFSINSPNELNSLFEEPFLTDWKSFLEHPSAVQKLTNLTIILPNVPNRGNSQLIDSFEYITVKEGESFKYILEFDHNKQGKATLINGIEVKY